MVKFLNAVPWGGLYFCYTPGQVIDLEADIAEAREKAGLGKVVKDKTKHAPPAPEPAPEPVAKEVPAELVTEPKADA